MKAAFPSLLAARSFLHPDAQLLESELHASMSDRFRSLNSKVARLVRAAWRHSCRGAEAALTRGTRASRVQVDDYSMVQFLPLDVSDEESIAFVLQHIDGAIAFGEDADVRTSRDIDV